MVSSSSTYKARVKEAGSAPLAPSRQQSDEPSGCKPPPTPSFDRRGERLLEDRGHRTRSSCCTICCRRRRALPLACDKHSEGRLSIIGEQPHQTFKMIYQMSHLFLFGSTFVPSPVAAGDNRVLFTYSRSTSYQSNDHQRPIDVRRMFYPAPLPPLIPGEGKPT